MTFSKYDEDFAHAMKTKLKLSIEKPVSEPEFHIEDMRESIVQKAMKENPSLTKEEALKMMEELGF